MEACQDGGVGGAEALVVGFFAEDLVVFKEGEDVVVVALAVAWRRSAMRSTILMGSPSSSMPSA